MALEKRWMAEADVWRDSMIIYGGQRMYQQSLNEVWNRNDDRFLDSKSDVGRRCNDRSGEGSFVEDR